MSPNKILFNSNPQEISKLQSKFAHESYEFIAVSTLKDTIEAVESNIYSCVFLDYSNTDTDENLATICKAIRTKAPSTPIIVIVDDHNQGPIEKSLNLNIQDVVVKPLTTSIIKTRIAVWVLRNRQQFLHK